MIKIIILGAGNVGTHLFRNLNNSKKTKVVQWYNRSLDSINKYKKEVAVTNQIKDLKEADVYLLALSDDVIPEMAKQLKHLNGIIQNYSKHPFFNSIQNIIKIIADKSFVKLIDFNITVKITRHTNPWRTKSPDLYPRWGATRCVIENTVVPN